MKLTEALDILKAVIGENDIPADGLRAVLSFENYDAAIDLETAFRYSYIVVNAEFRDGVRIAVIKTKGIELRIESKPS